MVELNNFDREMMQYCLQLARRAWGKTSPNPMVGSVIVRDGKIVGEGFHPRAGEPHAEVYALRAAGELARGATAYVSLEPCNHYGRTPPCTEALIAAGVTKVVVGAIDPDPRVSGGGIARLQAAGIEVVVDVEAEACNLLNEAFIHRVTHQLPWGILKYAMTLDGKIASSTGHSMWVTGTPARLLVHQLRSRCDAVVVGGNTVRKDNPHLTSHGEGDRDPIRVVMSRTLDLPRDLHLWNQEEASTLVFTEIGRNLELQDYLVARGIEVVVLNRLTPLAVMENLYQRQMCSVLWECGGTLAAQALRDGVVQKVMAWIAPKIIGGEVGFSAIGELGLEKMTDALILKKMSWQQIGQDFLIEGYL
jgi:diaminohydroxyphosphoribosylaminopyrimidine deaminase/5-amino-6-(5-phosphoribosylamino)uracil reductase